MAADPANLPPRKTAEALPAELVAIYRALVGEDAPLPTAAQAHLR